MKNHTNNKPKTIKKSVVITPNYVADTIYENVKRYPFKNILDIGAWHGSLSKPFSKKHNSYRVGIDITDEFQHKFDLFIHKDFLQTTKADFEGLNIDLILVNPPFGKSKQYGDLYPSLFIKRIFEIFGSTMPVIMIAGHWFVTNSNKRIKYLNGANITKITTLHHKTFSACGVDVDADILYFNIKQKVSVDFLDAQKEEAKKQRFKSVAFSDAQMLYVKENIDNFSGEMKKMIAEKYPDFPI